MTPRAPEPRPESAPEVPVSTAPATIAPGGGSFLRRHGGKTVLSLAMAGAFVWALRRGGLPLVPNAATMAEVRWGWVAVHALLLFLVHIVRAVRWCLRYGLSYRDVEELLGERGIEVDRVTIYRWAQRFTPPHPSPMPLDRADTRSAIGGSSTRPM